MCKEIDSLKSKINAASHFTETVHHYVIHRKRSLGLWVEDRTLLEKLGHIFRTSVVRKALSNNDLSMLQQQQQIQCNRHIQITEETLEEQSNNSLHRYYHVFQKGELSQLVVNNVPLLEILDESFTQGNWVVTARKL